MGSAEAEGRKEVERKVLESRKEVGSGSAAGVRNEVSSCSIFVLFALGFGK